MKTIFHAKRMMNRSRQIVTAVLLSIIFVLPGAVKAEAAEKVGVVDFGGIMQDMPETKRAEATLQATAAPLQKEFEKQKQDFENAVNAYKQQAAGMTKSAREQKEKELGVKSQGLQKYQQEKFGRGGIIDRKEKELVAPIRQKVLGAVQTVAQKEGFGLVLDKSAMIYNSQDNDLTPKVKSQLGIK